MAGSAPTTIVFDVLGTVLDEDAGILAAAVELAGPDAADGLRTSWKKGLSGEVGAINRGEAPYRLQDDLNVPVLDRALASFGLAAAPDASGGPPGSDTTSGPSRIPRVRSSGCTGRFTW